MNIKAAAHRAGLLLVIALIAMGCRTFNYTEADMAHERNLISEGLANYSRGWSGGWGGSVPIGNINPSIGSVCPGK